MRRWLGRLPITLYVLGVSLAVPMLVRARLEPSAWWPVALVTEGALYLVPTAIWFASIKPVVPMSARERMQRMLLTGSLLMALAFLTLMLPFAFLIFSGGPLAPMHSLVYLAIWFCAMLFWRRRPRKNAVEAYGRARGLPLDRIR